MARQLDLGKQQLWLGRVERWQRSQLTIRDFCARHDFSEPSFHGWKRILAERGLLSSCEPATTQPSTPLFVAATVAEVAVVPLSLEIVLADGVTVRVAAGFDAAALRQLLAILREPSC
jgi:hypothetical protein